MRVLVTGGTGFLGQHTCRVLSEKGHTPLAFDSSTDLRSVEMANVAFRDAQADALVHLACPMGGGNVKYAGMKEASLLWDMLLINTNVLEKARRYDVKRIITIGSVCEYPVSQIPDFLGGGDPWVPDDLWEGPPHSSHRAYGLAKRMLCEQGLTYAQQYGLQVTHLILSNLYGPGDKLNNLSHFIPSTIKKMIEDPKQVIVWGDGKPTRDFLYVDDAAHEIVKHVETYDAATPIANVCSEVTYSISAVVDMLKVFVPFGGQVLWDHGQPNGEMHRAMKRTLDPVQTTHFHDGLKRTIDWIQTELKVPR